MKIFLRLSFLFLLLSTASASSFLPIPGPGIPATGTFTITKTFDDQGNIATTTSPNTISVGVGTPSIDRVAIYGVGVSSPAGTSATTTLCGVAGTPLVTPGAAGGFTTMYSAAIGTAGGATTCNLVVTTAFTPTTIAYTVYDIKNYSSSTPTNTYSAGSTGGVNPASVSANIPSASIAIGFIANLNVSATVSWTWAGLTKDGTDQSAPGGVSRTSSQASAAFSSANPSLTISATSSGAVGYDFMVVGVWK